MDRSTPQKDMVVVQHGNDIGVMPKRSRSSVYFLHRLWIETQCAHARPSRACWQHSF
jgi:hypothetical protein